MSLLFAPLLLCCTALAAAQAEIVRPTTAYDRCGFAAPDQEARVKAAGTLAGYKAGEQWNPVSGWVEYDVAIAEAGWYEYLTPCDLWGMEWFVDGVPLPASGGRKLSNLWLEPGTHVLRVQRWNWTGFEARFERLILRPAGPEAGKAVRLSLADGRSIVRAGEELRLEVQAGGRAATAALTVQLVDRATRKPVASRELAVPSGTRPATVVLPLACPAEGVFQVVLAENGAVLPAADLPPLEVVVVDTTAPPRGGELRKTLVAEIDCAATEPAFTGAGGTRVVEGGGGRYREGGMAGFLHAQHHNQDSSWFAYRLPLPEAKRPYLLETEHPDDALRTFAIVIREAQVDAYPIAGGLDTGGCFPLSQRLQTHSLLFWPQTTEPRVVFVTAHNGRAGAAAARIRLYRVDGELPLPEPPPAGGRGFGNWYEEGSNFLGMFGSGRDLPGMLLGSDRWARAIAGAGGDLLMPTVSVYQMAMYPSEFNTSFCSRATFDLVRVLAMKCEKYGLGLVGEFHPECRELERLGDPGFTGKPRTDRMVNKDGHMREKRDETPRYHPLDPVCQDWYVGMVGEFADRYRDSPAFRGVNLRLMGWANPALNNFHSLDWGYDDLTVGLFERETGLATGAKADDPGRFQARHQWLMANARKRWIAWRCQKIAGIYTRLRDRVRQARPDLRVWSTTTDLGVEAGVDPRLLGAIDGVVLVHARHGYGRQAFTYEGPMADHRMRDQLIQPANLRALMPEGLGGAFLFGHRYFEATEKVVPPEAIGFPAATKRTWFSGVVTPPGRLFLERYALALAEADAAYLSDGGNTYTMGQPILHEFTREYRRLPAVPFRSRADASDPVTVRELARPQDLLFYAVNRERFPVQLAIQLTGAAQVRRLATGEAVAAPDGRLTIVLAPCQLIAFQAPAGAAIARVSTLVAAADRQPVEALVAGAARLADDVAAGAVQLGDGPRRLLAAAVAEAKAALAEGRLWRARTALESAALAEQVYNPAGVFPPGLEFLADPARALQLRAGSLVRSADPLAVIACGQADAQRAPVSGRLAGLWAACEGGAAPCEGRAGARAVAFDGAKARLAVQGGDAALLDQKDFSISLWLRPDKTDQRRGILSRQAWPGGVALLLWNGSLSFEAGDKAGNVTCRTGDSTLKAGQWIHVVATSAAGKALTLYVNGVQAAQVPMPRGIACPEAPCLVGWNGWGGRQNDQSPGWFAGAIGEIRLFDRALSAEEALAEWGGKAK